MTNHNSHSAMTAGQHLFTCGHRFHTRESVEQFNESTMEDLEHPHEAYFEIH